MRITELTSLTIQEWDGSPILCYVEKGLTNEITEDSIEITKVVGFNAEAQHQWGDVRGRVYHNVYPVSCNEEKVAECLNHKKRMTNRQLSMWLAKGNGEWTTPTLISSKAHYVCVKGQSNDFVDEDIRVRKWDSEEWIEPTVDLLEEC